MNKRELVAAVSGRTNHSQAITADLIEAVFAQIKTTIAAGGKVTINGFGTFEAVARPAREGRNPSTGEPIHIEATIVPKFKPGADFKAAVTDGAKQAGR